MKRNNGLILSINNLKKYFKEVKAVDGLSFELRPGEIYGLLGPNGAGKTTTIKNILGLLEPDVGNIKVLGMDPLENNEEIKTLIGYISEEPLVYKSLSPREMFDFISSIRNLDTIETTKIITDLLDSLEATKYYDSPIVTLSKGNKQKMQIISGLIHDPELLIMDEPLAGLDAKSSRVVKDILRIHASNGGAVLLSTHQMDTAENLCDRIGIINNGKMVAEGNLAELRN
ncbi:MAG: ABC transporter ATP-binding protein, partial [archaeon]|nr:ABC transporter ATP-binding protein [archaeon]